MAAFDFAFIQLLFKIIGQQTGEISRVNFLPEKPLFEAKEDPQPFERGTPESQGISSEHIRQFLKALREDDDANPHQVMIVRRGTVIAECSYAPYEKGMWHITHSMCKAFTGMAAGLLISEGKLDLSERVQDIFPEYTGPLDRIFAKTVTVEHLLNMTSEVDFFESGAISGNDWRQGFMSARCKCEPGTRFDYNSMNSYMLSAIIQKRTGMTMFDYLKEHIFTPLGITEVFWEKCPQGVTKGGWGMFLRPEDACKLGVLYMQKGKWKEQQLLPEEWVEKATSKQVDNGGAGYGFQVWMEDRPGGFAYNGLFGQNVLIFPDLELVIQINAGNRELFQSGNLTDLLHRYWGKDFIPEDVLPENPEAVQALRNTITEYGYVRKKERSKGVLGIVPPVRYSLSPDVLTDAVKGHRWMMRDGRMGLFPLVCQVMHNNFTDGIRSVGFEEEYGTLVLLLKEGEVWQRIRVGFEHAEKSVVNLRGEPYYVSTFGRVSQDEFDRIVLKCDIAFIEEACSRQLYFYFDGEGIEMRANETPGDDVIRDVLIYTGEQPLLERIPFVKSIAAGGGTEILEHSVQTAIHPTDFGDLVKDGAL